MRFYDGHILVFGHSDLDGAAAAALVKGAFDLGGYADRHGTRGRQWARIRTRGRDRRRVVCRRINYGPSEQQARKFIEKWHSRFIAIVFVDYSPNQETCALMDSLGVNYYVIDHHQTAFVQEDNPNAKYYMDYSVSGAMGVYNVLKDHLTVAHKSLAYLADDYDMWRHTNYMSKHLNVIYDTRYGFNSFIRHYAGGFHGIGRNLIENTIKPYYIGVMACFAELKMEPIPGNGVYVHLSEDCKYFSDVSLMLEKKFPWYVLDRTKKDSVSLSFRTRLDTINLGMVLQGIGMGGGGHAKAAGQRLPLDSDIMGFIGRVYDDIMECDPKAFG